MPQAAWKPILTLALATVLTACGFQLRGTGMVPDALAPLALSCGDGVPGPVCSGLRERLDLYKLLAEDGETAEYRLNLSGYEQERRTSALDDRAAAAEYELSARVAVELTTEDGIPLLADTELSAREFYQADEQQVLAGEREQQGIEGLLQDQLVQQVTRRLMPFTEERIRRIRSEHESSTDTDK
ncbi:LPS assembly lipoprotein LptE [Vreelandella utahensis]|uniref:LPS-assembly lipoprotein LptE n=1 Tax=Vreelandella halophila TaxID=86177 RepID=UPI0009862E33|nr:LPS assembly lipoprotein LptE [Halomonas utahensis]